MMNSIAPIITKVIASETLVDLLWCTNENIVDLVSAAVIPWEFNEDKLHENKNKWPKFTYCRKYGNAEKKANYTHVKCIPALKII
mgnify:CR=1 FL=1